MAITNTVIFASTGSLVNTLTSAGSLTVVAGDTISVGVVTDSSTRSVTSVVFNSGAQSLSLVDTQTASTTTRLEVWEITAPSAGTGTITVNLNGTSIFAFAATLHNGAASGAGYRDAAAKTSATASTTQSLTITSATNDLAFAYLGYKNTNGTWTADSSPVASLGSQTTGSGTSHSRIAVLTETGAASTSPSSTTSASKDWCMIGFNLNLAGAGADPDRVRQMRASQRRQATAQRQRNMVLSTALAQNTPIARAVSNAAFGTATPGTGLSGVGIDGRNAASRIRRVKRRR